MLPCAAASCLLLKPLDGDADFVEKKGLRTFDFGKRSRYNDSNGQQKVYLKKRA
jgi:hypothetical protein